MLNKLIDAIDAPYFDLPWGMATPALILSVIYCFLLLAFFLWGKKHNTVQFIFVSLCDYSQGKKNRYIISAIGYLLLIPVCIVFSSFLNEESLISNVAATYLEYEPIVFLAVLLFLCSTALNTTNQDRHIIAANRLFQVSVIISIGTGLLSGQIDYSMWQNKMVICAAGIIYCVLPLVEVKTNLSSRTKTKQLTAISYTPAEVFDQLFPQHKNQAEYISRIIEAASSDPLSICLSGKWGSGKTSVINGVIDKLSTKEQSDYVFIRINALEIDSKTSLLNYLFAQIKMLLREKGVYVGIDSEYKEFVASAAGQVATGAIGTMLQKKLLHGNDDYRQQKKNLEDVLERAFRNGKIVVVVDDIERCTQDLAREYLFLIKEVATMKNCVSIFVTDYKMLDELVLGNGSNKTSNPSDAFLDKFFNYKIDMYEEPADNILAYYDKCFDEKDASFESIYQVCGMSPATWYKSVVLSMETKIKTQEDQLSRTHVSEDETQTRKQRIERLKACKSIFIDRMQVPRSVVKFYNLFQDNVYRCYTKLLLNIHGEEAEIARKYIADRNIGQIMFLLSFVQVCLPEEHQQLVKLGASYAEPPRYGEPAVDNPERQLLIEIMESTVYKEFDNLHKPTGYLKSEIRLFIEAFLNPDSELKQLINTFTTQEEKWCNALKTDDENVLKRHWDEIMAMILQKVPGKESGITNQWRNENFSKLLTFAERQVELGDWTYDKILSLFDRDAKTDRAFSLGTGLFQVFEKHIRNYKISANVAKQVLEELDVFLPRYLYLRAGCMYRLAHYLIPIDKNDQTDKIQEYLIVGHKSGIENLSIFLSKLAEHIPGITLSGKDIIENYQKLSKHIYDYLKKQGLLMFEEVKEETDTMMDTVDELHSIVEIIKHFGSVEGVKLPNPPYEVDVNNIEQAVQYFEALLNSDDRIRDRDVDKQFTDFFKQLQNAPKLILDVKQIERLHNLVSLYVEWGGYNSLPFRRQINEIFERSKEKHQKETKKE